MAEIDAAVVIEKLLDLVRRQAYDIAVLQALVAEMEAKLARVDDEGP